MRGKDKIVCLHTILVIQIFALGCAELRNRFQRKIKKPLCRKQRGCGDEWARTTDSRIFSPMLYQLSYITVSGHKVS